MREDKIRNYYKRNSIEVASVVDKITDNIFIWLRYVLRRENTEAIRLVEGMFVEIKGGR